MARPTSPRVATAPPSSATSTPTRTGAGRTATRPKPDAPPAPEPLSAQLAAQVPERIDRPGPGQPPRLNRYVAQRLCTHIREGNYFEVACKLSGIGYRTFLQWMERGEAEQKGPYAQFARAVHQAEAEAEAEMINRVRAAAAEPRNWAAGMTFLERRHPDRWGKRSDANGLGGHGVTLNIGIALPGTASASPQVVDAVTVSIPELPKREVD